MTMITPTTLRRAQLLSTVCGYFLGISMTTSPASLISYYNFDDGATVTDQVGANDGTVISDATFSADTPDGSAGSLDLNGSAPQDYVRLGDASPSGPDFNIGTTNSFTISMWVCNMVSERGIVTIKQDLTGGGGDRSGITFGISGTGSPFIGLIHSSLADDAANGGATFHDVQTDQTIATAIWTHMAASYNSTTDTLAVYVDGVAASVYTDGNGASTMNSDGTNLTGGVGVIDLVDDDGSFTGFGASGNAPQHADSAGDFTRLFFDGTIDDVAIWDEALAAGDVALLAAGTKPTALVTDSDGDGMPDEYENMFAFLDPNDDGDADLDQDSDGLSNLQECRRGTTPDDDDSDDDGLTDGAEVDTHGTDPLVADSDGDGLDDQAEIETHSTDPNDDDSDDDTILDGEEVVAGDDGFTTNPNQADTDSDTFDDNIEIAAGTSPVDADDFPEAPGSGLISYYDFDDGATVTDQVGINHGTVISSAGFSNDTPDGSANSLDLGGNAPQDYVRIGPASPDAPDFGIADSDSFTISMWVNYSASERGIVTIKQDLTSGGGDRSGITLGIDGNGGSPFVGFIVSTGDDAGDMANGGVTFSDVKNELIVPTGVWSHLAASYDSLSDTLAVYVNGTAATSFSANPAGTINPDGTNLTGGLGMIDFVDRDGSFTGFGASGNGPTAAGSAGDFTRLYYDGLLDEVGIWNIALEPDEIELLATGVSPPALGGGLAPFQITEVDFDFPNNSVTLTWNSRPGRVYAVESSTNLINWSEIDDSIPSDGTTTTYTDTSVPDPATSEKVFYRIRIPE